MNLDIVTIVIIAANVIISMKGFDDFSFFEKYKFHIGGINRGEQSRMFTSGFLHGDMQHLVFNMITLFFFAPYVIDKVGSIKFLIIYICSLIAGSLLSFVFHKNNYNYSAIGASGAVTGILYAAILFEPDMYINFIIPGWLFGIGYLAYSIYGMKNKIGNIGHDAHFGGAIAGYVLSLIFVPSLMQEEFQLVILLAIPIVVLFILMKLGKI